MPEKPHDAITVAESLAECVAGADLAIENVSEKLDVKIKVFQEIEAAVSKDCIIASDTSGIPITKIQEGIATPGAGDRHALVEPAAHHPDDRGDPRRQDRSEDHRGDDRDREADRPSAGADQEGRAGLRREPRALFASCANASIWWSRA